MKVSYLKVMQFSVDDKIEKKNELTVNNQKQPKYSLRGEWINKLLHTDLP